MAAICVLMLTTDKVYCQKIVSYLGKRHSNVKVTILNSNLGLEESISQNICNVMLIGEEFSDLQIKLPQNISCAYLTSTETGKKINGKESFCKYRSGEVIYKHILSLFSEVSLSDTIVNDGSTPIYAFVNSNGGAGATTAAAAFCYRLASTGKNVLYLNLDKLSDFSQFFLDGSSVGDMSDLIFIIKSNTQKNINLSAKAASLLKRDNSNVRYIENCKLSCDFDEVSQEQLDSMFNAIIGAENFDCVVIDGNVYDTKTWQLICNQASKIFVVVTTNNLGANGKLVRFLSSITASEARTHNGLSSKVSLIFNRNSEKDWQEFSGATFHGFATLGSLPTYKDNKSRSISEAIAKLDIWNLIIK